MHLYFMAWLLGESTSAKLLGAGTTFKRCAVDDKRASSRELGQVGSGELRKQIEAQKKAPVTVRLPAPGFFESNEGC
jgi:hypothetical protein